MFDGRLGEVSVRRPRGRLVVKLGKGTGTIPGRCK